MSKPITNILGERINPDLVYHLICELREDAPRVLVEGDLKVFEYSVYDSKLMKRPCNLSSTRVGWPFQPQDSNLLNPNTKYMYLCSLDFNVDGDDLMIAVEVIKESLMAGRPAILRL